jgi:hypothetical protein
VSVVPRLAHEWRQPRPSEAGSPGRRYPPTEIWDQGIAGKLGIPAADLRRLREQRPALYGGSVNGWLGGDDRRFLVRCLRGDGSGGASSVMAAGGRGRR